MDADIGLCRDGGGRAFWGQKKVGGNGILYAWGARWGSGGWSRACPRSSLRPTHVPPLPTLPRPARALPILATPAMLPPCTGRHGVACRIIWVMIPRHYTLSVCYVACYGRRQNRGKREQAQYTIYGMASPAMGHRRAYAWGFDMDCTTPAELPGSPVAGLRGGVAVSVPARMGRAIWGRSDGLSLGEWDKAKPVTSAFSLLHRSK